MRAFAGHCFSLQTNIQEVAEVGQGSEKNSGSTEAASHATINGWLHQGQEACRTFAADTTFGCN